MKNNYNRLKKIDTLGAFPGADREKNLLRVGVVNQDVQFAVIQEAGETFEVEPVQVSGTDGSPLTPATEETLAQIAAAANDGALDVSGGTVTMTDDGTLSVATGPLDGALGTNATDQLLVQEDTPLDVSGATVTIQEATPLDVADRAARALGDVTVSGISDTVQTEDHDQDALNGTTLAADASLNRAFSAPGADELVGRIVATGSYDVEISWLDDTGTEVFRDEVAAGVAGGTETSITQPAIYPDFEVIITDASAAENTVSGVLHLR